MNIPGPNVEACAREPIHIPGSVQPHGLLLAVAPDDGRVVSASGNAAALLGLQGGDLAGRPVADLPGAVGDVVERWRSQPSPSLQSRLRIGERQFETTLHDSGGLVLLEMEPTEAEPLDVERLYAEIGEFVDQLKRLSEPADMARLAGAKIRAITGYDRVLTYRFDADLHGTVIAEDRNERLPAYLGRRFPGSDVPAQARELYRRNPLRLIPDAYYEPSPLEPDHNPLTDGPIDLSNSVLRSVSPVHVEYMRNMGTGASMSASIVVDGALWGLLSCHNAEPRRVPLQVRNAIVFTAQILSNQVATSERSRDAAERVTQKTTLSRLLARMTGAADFAASLASATEDLLAQTDADSAAVVHQGQILRVGRAPDEAAIQSIVEWLAANRDEEVFATDSLAAQMEGAEAFAGEASGLLAVSISSLHPSYVLWFRTELVRTVEWGGDPHKPAAEGRDERLHPRRSFESWREQVRQSAAPWRPSEIEAAAELRTAIIGIVLRQAEERARLTNQLQTTNKELESFSYSISHDLRAPFRHIVGYAELLREQAPDIDEQAQRYLSTIIESAVSAGRLVDDLLRFSQLGRTSLNRAPVNLDKLVAEVRQSLATEQGDREIDWQVGRLPGAVGDGPLLRQVIYNLVENAIKYTRQAQAPRIEISGWRDGDATVLRIRDNGVGFDMAYVHKLFGVFQRLHHTEDFEGTGIGLAIVRRIVERHGGAVRADGTLDEGAQFTLTLPDALENPENE